MGGVQRGSPLIIRSVEVTVSLRNSPVRVLFLRAPSAPSPDDASQQLLTALNLKHRWYTLEKKGKAFMFTFFPDITGFFHSKFMKETSRAHLPYNLRVRYRSAYPAHSGRRTVRAQ